MLLIRKSRSEVHKDIMFPSYIKQSEKACIICASIRDVLEFKLAQALFDEIKAPQIKAGGFVSKKRLPFGSDRVGHAIM